MKIFKKITGIFLCASIILSAAGCKRESFGRYDDEPIISDSGIESNDQSSDESSENNSEHNSEYNSESSSGAEESFGSEESSGEASNPTSEVDKMTVLEMVEDMKIGWNLGNTFDASDCTWLSDEMQYESAWNGVMTREENIQALKDAGFKAIRVPVSWHNHVDTDYKISEPWLERVAEVVGWCLDRDMYVILNIHHDNSTQFMFPDTQHLEQSKKYVTTIWEQLSERFKDYSHKLIFESMNEPRLVGHNNEWWIDPNNADCKDAISCINEINQAFVNTVRASGGLNASRYLMCPGYDASADGALNDGYVLPTDPVSENQNRIIVTVHAYVPYEFALNRYGTDSWSQSNKNDTDGVTVFMDNLYNKFISKGTAVIIDEFGALDKNGNLSVRTEFTAFYVKSARERKMTCFWWDNNFFDGDGEKFGLLDRNSNTWRYDSIVKALVENS